MKALLRSLTVAFVLVAGAAARADLTVATSLEDLASVASIVGGSHVKAFSLCKGYQDPHFVPAKPSLMRLLRTADVFVSVGLELDGGWLPVVLPGSRNPKIQPGGPGFVDASDGVDVLEKPSGTVNRAEGDIHPLGNPHYYMDPERLIPVARHLAKVFGELDPAHAEEYGKNAAAFADRMTAALTGWRAQLAPFAGKGLVTFHTNFAYFLNRFDFKLFGTVEAKPGIPPTPRHLAELGAAMQAAGVRVVLYQPYQDAEASRELARKAGARALEIPTEVGGVPAARDVFTKFDFIVHALVEALS